MPKTTLDLKDKIAIVTGAGRGTGRAIALALGGAGARVVVVDVNPDSAQRTADEIVQAGGAASVQVVDVSNKLAVQTMIYAVLEAHARVDILVNAAHVTPALRAEGSGASALRLDEWEWNRTVDVNLKGAFLVSQTVARAMSETGGGIILNVLRPSETSAHAAVRAAHEGLIGLTAALAPGWAGFGVRVEALETGGHPDRAAAEASRRCVNFWSSAPGG
jgi:NAD(P)-dependent dehydrogenase (short-subunit alcohol dehydrogenase family)